MNARSALKAQSRLAMLFRIGEQLFALDALAVRIAVLRSDALVFEDKDDRAFIQRRGKDLPVTLLAPFLEGSARDSRRDQDWFSVIVLGHGSTEFAIAVGKCEVVREIRELTTIPRGILRDLEAPVTGIFSVGAAASLGLGIVVDVERLVRRLESRAKT
jgi:chemotaxis signal transduction protein